MKKLMISAALVSSTAFAQTAYTDYAMVTRVTPQYTQSIESRQVCQDQQNYAPQEKSYTGAVIGTVAGGLLGNQIGGGHGKTLATAAGAVIGAMTGDHIDNKPNQNGRTCRTIDTPTQILSGYIVEYDYNGKRGSFRTNQPPQNASIPISVSIQPQNTQW